MDLGNDLKKEIEELEAKLNSSQSTKNDLQKSSPKLMQSPRVPNIG